MDDLTRYSLDQLIELALEERLIDACEWQSEGIVIIQRTTRISLTFGRAHAFLRGVLQGMRSADADGRPAPFAGRPMDRTAVERAALALKEGVPQDLHRAFRRHLVTKWWERYKQAGCPFHPSVAGLTLWVRYNTSTTVN